MLRFGFGLVMFLLLAIEILVTLLPVLICRWVWLWLQPADFIQKVVLLIVFGCFALPVQIWFLIIGVSGVLATVVYACENWEKF